MHCKLLIHCPKVWPPALPANYNLSCQKPIPTFCFASPFKQLCTTGAAAFLFFIFLYKSKKTWYNKVATQVNIFSERTVCYFCYRQKCILLFGMPMFAMQNTCVAAIGVVHFSCAASAAHFLFWRKRK